MGNTLKNAYPSDTYQYLLWKNNPTERSLFQDEVDDGDTEVHRLTRHVSQYEITESSVDDQSRFMSAYSDANGGCLIIDCTVDMTDDVDLSSSNVKLIFENGGKISVAPTKSINFGTSITGCSFDDTLEQIFEFQGSILVKGVIKLSFWRPEWFGAFPEDNDADVMGKINEFFDGVRDVAPAYPRNWAFQSGKSYRTKEPLKFINTGILGSGMMNGSAFFADSHGDRRGSVQLRNVEGGKIIDAGVTTSGGTATTQCKFFGLQFYGLSGGLDQLDYCVDSSALDLVLFENCGWLYCKYGLQHLKSVPGNAGSWTNCYIVDSVSNSGRVTVNMQTNARFTNLLMENSVCNIEGNAFEPFSIVNSHVENCTINVNSGMFLLEKGGITSSVGIYLGPYVHDSYVWLNQGRNTYMDLGHNNSVRGGARLLEHDSIIPSSIKPMWFQTCSSNGQGILQKNVPWVLSVGVSVDEDSSPFDFKLENAADGSTWKTYSGIVANDTDGTVPAPYYQIWDLAIPENNIFLDYDQPGSRSKIRASRPLNNSPDMSDSYISGSDIDGFKTGGATVTLSSYSDKVRITYTGASTWFFEQWPLLKQGKKYVLVSKFTSVSGGNIPTVYIYGSPTNPNTVYTVTSGPVNIGGNEYLSVVPFSPAMDFPLNIAFGGKAVDCYVNFFAVVEVSDEPEYISNGPPEVGVFYHGDYIKEENMPSNGAEGYVCIKKRTSSIGPTQYGICAVRGDWESGTSYTVGDCVSYLGVAYVCESDTSGTTSPNSDPDWRVLTRAGDGGDMFADRGDAFIRSGGLSNIEIDDAYTARNVDDIIRCDPALGSFSVTLMRSYERFGDRPLYISNIDKINDVTVEGSSEMISGSSTYTLSPSTGITIIPGNSSWEIY